MKLFRDDIQEDLDDYGEMEEDGDLANEGRMNE